MIPASSTTQSDLPTQLTDDLIRELSAVPLLASLGRDQFRCLEPLQLVQPEPGAVLSRRGEAVIHFWILLEGLVEILDHETQADASVVYLHERGAAFGEVALLANIPNTMTWRTRGQTRLLRFDENAFWALMTACPEVRQAILRNMAMRLQKSQHYTVQQEKMAALGTLAAGLMHELNNPGAAARRAASQLRQNFLRLHELSMLFNHRDMSAEQKVCLMQLERQALRGTPPIHLNSIEQSDAEETLSAWMDAAKVPNAWKIAPSFAAVGVTAAEMECARHVFPADTFINAVTWIEALASSVQLIDAIEESIGRVTELVKSVKTYAYEGGEGQSHSVSLNDSIHATLVILGHKLREKQVSLTKDFSADLPPIRCVSRGLNQIWTNLIDNAIDAASPGGHIAVKTWPEVHAGVTQLCVLISDDGQGIRPEAQPHIFDPFFTTKGPGEGTGLGLGIVRKLVEQNKGAVWFSSQPGQTQFLVRLPAEQRVGANA